MAEESNRDNIEEAGKVLEKFGLTPMQGRILAYFMIADKPEASFADLVAFFNASKSSISTSLNFLLSVKLVDYRTYSSERKKYFYLTDRFFTVYFSQVLNNVRQLKELCYKALSIRSSEYPETGEKLLRWIECANIFDVNIPGLLEKTEQE